MVDEKIKEIREEVEKLLKLEGAHSILLFGSVARGESDERSDIDICIVAPEAKNKEKLANRAAGMLPRNYDVSVFEQLPLYMKIEVIRNHVILYTKDKLELYEYFYKYRKIWRDQEHRQKLTKEEAEKLIRAK